MKQYLITGGAGFIGHHLTDFLLKQNHAVKILDNFTRSDETRLSNFKDNKNFSFYNIDIKKYSEVENLFSGIDCVYHLAAINGTENFYKIPIEILEVGTYGCINVIKAADRYGVKDLIVASSAEVYQNPSKVPTNESASLSIPEPHNPRYSYALSKIFSEIYSLNYDFKNKTKLKIFRPHNIYGPNMGYKHVVPEFIQNLSQSDKEFFTPKGDINTTRAFCYVSDLINGLEILENSDTHKEIFHIGNDYEVTILELFNKISKLMGVDVEIEKEFVNQHEGSPSRRCPDISKIRSLGYEPKISLENGLKNTIEWYAQNKIINRDYI